MEASQTGTSLLLTLLTTDAAHEYPIRASEIDPGIPKDKQQQIQENIDAVVKPREGFPGASSLIRNIAKKKLYDVLYEIIEREYEEPEHEPETDAGKEKAAADRRLNQTLTGAIGMALEMAISEDSDARIRTLRDELRKQILEALTPE